MDEQLTYAKELLAAGHTLLQVKDALLRRGVDERTVYVILRELQAVPPHATPAGSAWHDAAAETVPAEPAATVQTPKVEPTAREREAALANLAAYAQYVEALRSRGWPWEAIDTDLMAHGLSDNDRRRLYGEVQKLEAAAAAPAPAPVVQVPAQPSVPPAATPVAPAPAPAPEAAAETALQEQLLDTAEHLGQVVEHLSGVVEELDTELHNTAKPAASVNETAERLASTTSHLAEAVKKLEDDAKLPSPGPPPGAPPSTPNAAAPVPPLTPIQGITPQPQPPALPNPGASAAAPAVPSATPPVAPQTGAEAAAKPAAKVNVPLVALGAVVFGVAFVMALASHQRHLIWLGLVGMNVVGTASFDLLLRGSSWRQVDRWLTATILQTGLFLPFLAKEVAAPIHFPHYTPFDILLLGCAVTLLITMQFCNVKALQYLEASVFSVVYNTRILFATLLGFVFLAESVGLLSLVGGLVIFVAIFIVRQRGTKGITKQGIIFGLGAALAMSAMNTCEKELIKLVGYEQYIFPMFAIAAVVMWTIVLLRGTEAPFKLLVHPRGLLLMALRACAGISFSYSLVFGPVAVSSYISSLSVVLIVVFGMLFLGERDYLKSKLAATGTAVAGLTAILLDGL